MGILINDTETLPSGVVISNFHRSIRGEITVTKSDVFRVHVMIYTHTDLTLPYVSAVRVEYIIPVDRLTDIYKFVYDQMKLEHITVTDN
jgi:hypothetical protein